MNAGQLVPSISIDNLVNQRAAVVERLQRATALVREAAEIAKVARVGMPCISISTGYSRHAGEFSLAAARLGADRNGSRFEKDASAVDDVQNAIRIGVDASAWQYLMHESGLRTLMDATAREAWDKSISEGKFPELTKPNIEATFAELYGNRGDMFERGVIACFKALAWCYKTNLPQKFGKRIVVSYLSGSYSTGKTNQLDDLVRVMSVLDGKPEPDHRNGIYSALCKSGANNGKAAVIETEYLQIRTFKNRNGHITFKRLDLVDRMNKIIASHYPGALPAPKS